MQKAVAKLGFATAILTFADEKWESAATEASFAVTKGGFADEIPGFVLATISKVAASNLSFGTYGILSEGKMQVSPYHG